MNGQFGKRVSNGRVRTVSLAGSTLALALAGALLSGCGSAEEAKPQASAAPTAERPSTFEVSLKPDIPEGYTDRVGKYEKPLRQDVTTMKLVRRDDGAFNIEFAADAKVPAIEAVDFRPFMPRVPDLAGGNSDLKRIALIQRELNRNQTRYPMPGFGSAWIANNCLKKGLWEIGLDKKDDQGNWVTTCHAWFTFPKDEYARLFAEVNAPGNDPAVQPHADYPELNGLAVAMDALRSVKKEVSLTKIESNLDQPIAALPEQARKVKLIVAPQAKTYADWVAPDKQPVTTAKFSEPGFYINADPVKFDLAWLGKPAAAQWREAKSDAAKTELVVHRTSNDG